MKIMIRLAYSSEVNTSGISLVEQGLRAEKGQVNGFGHLA